MANYVNKCDELTEVQRAAVIGNKFTQVESRNLVKELYWDNIVEDYVNSGEDPKKLEKIVSIKYSRCIVETILSDPNCEGIRFYFTKKIDDTPTLVLVGFDKDERDLTTDNKSG